MSAPRRLTLLVVAILFVGATGTAAYVLLAPQLRQDTAPNGVTDTLFGWKFPVARFPSTGSTGNTTYSDIRDPGGIPQGLPVRLQIPVIGVDSAIEDALITSDGRMDVPAGSVDVAWFALGPHPGQVGSAVIGGHYGISNGVPWVFYKLDKLKVGDKVYIVDDKADTLVFVVRSTKSFDRNGDATTVFTSSDGLSHLNLITCEGIWNQVNGSYPQRLVVFTDLLPSEGKAPTSAASAAPAAGMSGTSFAFSRSFGIGATGADVVALQTFLEQRGLLELPSGVTNGFFGTLTSAAVSKYQRSVGLPAVGVFGPLTKAKVAAVSGNKLLLPSTGTVEEVATSSGAEVPSTSPRSFVQVMQSLYDTPLDGLITLLLLLSIVFTAFKIIRR